MTQAQPRRADECGVPDSKKFLHPKLAANYGNWKTHDRPRPGVLHHVAKTGDEVWSVRAGTQRQMDVSTIRKLCDIADQFAEGHVRFTIRSNIESMVSDEAKVAPLIAKLEAEGFPVGGTCTSVCPTCFCSTFSDHTPLGTDEAVREQSWASCFQLEHSHLGGRAVRGTPAARYRQWLTHKLQTWPEQFGTLGCVGCGRCTTWCPAGIDIVDEAIALTGGTR